MFFDRAADIAETPSAPLRYGLPGRVLVDLIRPADWLEPGETPAQEARCPAVGNTLMSAPVSAMNARESVPALCIRRVDGTRVPDRPVRALRR